MPQCLMRIRNLIAVLILCLFVVQCISIVDYSKEERYLSGLMDSMVPRFLPPSNQAIKVVEALRGLPEIQNSSYFLLPIFSFLRPMPRQVLKQGGDCGDRSRLVIRLLRLRGINASKWALYTQEMKSVHAVVELEAETGKMVLDPLFALWFPRSDGGYYGIRELRQSPSILQDRVHNLLQEKAQPGGNDLRSYPLNEYTYQYAKSINWEKWVGLFVVYESLKLVMGPAIDDLRRPAFVETPQLMVVIIAGAIQGGLGVLYLAHVRTVRRNKIIQPNAARKGNLGWRVAQYLGRLLRLH